MKQILRKIKRAVFNGGYSVPAYSLLCSLGLENKKSIGDNKGKIYINLSFDTEFGLNGPFWRGNYKRAALEADKIIANFYPVCEYLNENNIRYNVQICGGLLDSGLADSHIFSEGQRKIINDNPRYYHLDKLAIARLTKDNVEIGSHGFSHRRLIDLTKKEAEWEVKESVDFINRTFGGMPLFMSYPNNKIAHEDILANYNLRFRSDQNGDFFKECIPLGLCLSPALVTPRELDSIIKKIKSRKSKFLLHLWQHFSETNREQMREYVDVMVQNNCELINIKNYKQL